MWLIRISLCFIVLMIAVYLVTDPVLQKTSYHLLADNRSSLLIPNFSDVISNIPFAIIGWLGLLFS